MPDAPCLPRRLAVRSPNWLGDAVMAMPALEALRREREVEISILCQPKLVGLWKLLPWVREVIPIPGGILSTAMGLRKRHFEGILVLPNSLRTGLEAFLAGIPMRVGFEGHWRRHLLTHTRPRLTMAESHRHQALDYLELLFWREENLPAPQLPEVVKPGKPPITEPYFVICPGAEYGPAKRWPAERFATVAMILWNEGLKPVILGARSDIPAGKEMERLLTHRCVNLTGKTGFDEFLCHLAHARLLLCNDSGAMHIASLLRTPAVAVFGSTEDTLTGPLHPCVRVVREKPECSPCFLRVCPIDFRCMLEIDTPRVLAEARAALQNSA